MKIGAIVLAAGESRRMGTQKLLLPFAGTTVIRHIVGQVRAGGLDEIVAVVGQDREQIESALQGSGATTVYNARFREGMLSSVRAGISAASHDWGAYCIVLGDSPAIDSRDVARLVQELGANPGSILIPVVNSRRGHPVIIPGEFREEILREFDDVGLRGLMQRHAARIREIPMEDDRVLRDMDYPEDYQRELGLSQNRISNP